MLLLILQILSPSLFFKKNKRNRLHKIKTLKTIDLKGIHRMLFIVILKLGINKSKAFIINKRKVNVKIKLVLYY